MKSWQYDNKIEIYLTYNEGKCVVGERFVRTLRSNIYKYMTTTSKHGYIHRLYVRVDKCSKTYHGSLQKKPTVVKTVSYTEYGVEPNDKDPEFKVSDYIKISK